MSIKRELTLRIAKLIMTTIADKTTTQNGKTIIVSIDNVAKTAIKISTITLTITTSKMTKTRTSAQRKLME